MDNKENLIPFILMEAGMCIALITLAHRLGTNAWIAYAGAAGWGLYCLSNIQRVLKEWKK